MNIQEIVATLLQDLMVEFPDIIKEKQGLAADRKPINFSMEQYKLTELRDSFKVFINPALAGEHEQKLCDSLLGDKESTFQLVTNSPYQNNAVRAVWNIAVSIHDAFVMIDSTGKSWWGNVRGKVSGASLINKQREYIVQNFNYINDLDWNLQVIDETTLKLAKILQKFYTNLKDCQLPFVFQKIADAAKFNIKNWADRALPSLATQISKYEKIKLAKQNPQESYEYPDVGKISENYAVFCRQITKLEAKIAVLEDKMPDDVNLQDIEREINVLEAELQKQLARRAKILNAPDETYVYDLHEDYPMPGKGLNIVTIKKWKKLAKTNPFFDLREDLFKYIEMLKSRIVKLTTRVKEEVVSPVASETFVVAADLSKSFGLAGFVEPVVAAALVSSPITSSSEAKSDKVVVADNLESKAKRQESKRVSSEFHSMPLSPEPSSPMSADNLRLVKVMTERRQKFIAQKAQMQKEKNNQENLFGNRKTVLLNKLANWQDLSSRSGLFGKDTWPCRRPYVFAGPNNLDYQINEFYEILVNIKTVDTNNQELIQNQLFRLQKNIQYLEQAGNLHATRNNALLDLQGHLSAFQVAMVKYLWTARRIETLTTEDEVTANAKRNLLKQTNDEPTIGVIPERVVTGQAREASVDSPSSIVGSFHAVDTPQELSKNIDPVIGKFSSLYAKQKQTKKVDINENLIDRAHRSDLGHLHQQQNVAHSMATPEMFRANINRRMQAKKEWVCQYYDDNRFTAKM